MARYCSTRLLKNVRFLQAPEVGFFPQTEPPDGFESILPAAILRRLERIPPQEIEISELAAALSKKRPPAAHPKLAAPLFSGTLKFVQVAFDSSGRSFEVPMSDVNSAIKYAVAAAVPISEYCSQYGPNSLAVAAGAIPFSAPVTNAKYNDSTLSAWVDQLAKANGLKSDSCLVFLNPQGVVNTDADATKGALGYHSVSSAGVPYAFVNVTGTGLTVQDRQDYYALALSHEIAEMTVDPMANGSNPEVSDECAGNCGVDYRNYFDSNGNWLGGAPTPDYSFFTDGIATPATVAQCPAPVSSCTYPPPKH